MAKIIPCVDKYDISSHPGNSSKRQMLEKGLMAECAYHCPDKKQCALFNIGELFLLAAEAQEKYVECKKEILLLNRRINNLKAEKELVQQELGNLLRKEINTITISVKRPRWKQWLIKYLSAY